MKKILLSSLIAAAAAVPAVAGVNNINYQAVIKDGNGVMADKKVELKFELLDNDEVVYYEEQTPTTNASGLVTCQLGGEDEFTNLPWGDLTLRVSIKLGADYEVISNEAVSSVPTALYAVKTADSDMIMSELDHLVAESEETKATLHGYSAEIARIDGLAQDFENMGENLDNAFGQMQAQLEEVNGQIENLNNVAAVVRSNEDKLDNLDGVREEVENLIASNEENKATLLGYGAEIARIDGLAQDFENMGENLDNAFGQMQAQFEEVNGQIENLNNVSAVVRSNEEKLEKLDGVKEDVENLVAENEETKSTLRNMNAEIARIDGLAQDFDNLGENLDNAFGMMQTMIEQLQNEVESLKAEIEELKNK